MMKNILIIGCGLIGSSVLRAVHAHKGSKNIYIYEIEMLEENMLYIFEENIFVKIQVSVGTENAAGILPFAIGENIILWSRRTLCLRNNKDTSRTYNVM